MWRYCNAVRQQSYDWTVITADTTNYNRENWEFPFRKVIPSGVSTIKVIWWPLVFISKPRGLLRDGCEWLVSWVSAGSFWHDIQLLRLPAPVPEAHISVSIPPALTGSVAQTATAGARRAEQPGWGWEMKQQQFVTTRRPSHLADSKRMKALSCDCRRWCIGPDLSQVLTMRSELRDTRSPAPQRGLSTISIRPNHALTASGSERLRWLLAPPFGVQCTCPGHSQRTDLRPEEKKKKKRKEKETRCDEENPSQQQLEYWQQHMQNVSSWARGAIISDRQTNTWHWFDLSICRPEREATGGLKKEP